MTTKERQDILSNFYRFRCLCSLCVVPSSSDDDDDFNNDTATTIQSDDITPVSTWTETKQKTKTTNSDKTTSLSSSSPLPSFEKWCLDPTFPDDILINSHLRALQIFTEQGYDNDDHDYDYDHPTLARRDMDIKHLDAIAMCYGALEDVDNFRKWLKRVSEVRSRIKPKQKLVFSKWLSNPTTFPVWGWRRVFCGDEEDVKSCSSSGNSSGQDDSDSGLSTCVSMGMFDYI